jgi:hypothetical protein
MPVSCTLLLSRFVLPAAVLAAAGVAAAQPTVTDGRLKAEVVATGLPTGIDNLVAAMVMLDERTGLLCYRATGQIRRIDLPGLSFGPVAPVTAGPLVADLDIIARTPGDGQSEYGVQGIVTDPGFPTVPYIYIRYDASPTPGVDTPQSAFAEFTLPSPQNSVVDRFIWDPSGNGGVGSLAFDRRIHTADTMSRYHHGGPPVFGPDGTLYIPLGDNRLSFNRAFNNEPSVQFQAGVIHRINADGTVPADNPFPVAISGWPGTEKWFAYGFRNIFGTAIDPWSTAPGGGLWVTENGEATYDELNYVPRSANGGFTDIAGPTGHPRQTGNINGLIQTPGEPGSFYIEPKFSWYQTTGVTGLAFLAGSALGPAFDSRILVANYNTPFLYWFELNASRTALVLRHPGLQDAVDDRLPSNQNPTGTESAETLLGRGFGTPFSGGVLIAQTPRLRVPLVVTADGRIIRVTRRCWADVAAPGLTPGADGTIDGDDFIAFINAFAIGEALADLASGGEPGPDGTVDGDDFITFINGFAAGC